MAAEDDLVCHVEDPTQIMSPYEQSRVRRIRDNLERMRKMGIPNIIQKLRPPSAGHRKRGRPTSSAVAARPRNEDVTLAGGGVPRLTPLRRSSRLQNASPVTYSEVLLSGRTSGRTKSEKGASVAANKQILLEERPIPEAYTEEHEKLLDTTEKNWELFVDGFEQDGRRIYDPFKGKTCHQCRQKTLGHRTKCGQCGMLHGQFCGDCLFMRYGEHVLEALENPKWTCPVCRGICNCSLCRKAKGWAPTGPLYRKISSMGFKSVAHYLIQTQRLQLKLDAQNHSGPPAHLPSKRSLPFSSYSECKETPENNIEIKQCHVDSMQEWNGHLATNHLLVKRSLSFISDDNNTVAEEETLNDQIGTEEHSEDQCFLVKNRSVSKDAEQVKKQGSYSELNQHSIGERLQLTKNFLCVFSDDNNVEIEEDSYNQRGNKEKNEGHGIVVATVREAANSFEQVKKHGSCSVPNQNDIGEGLGLTNDSLCLLSDDSHVKMDQPPDNQRDNKEQNEGHHIVVAGISVAANSLNPEKKYASYTELNQESIGGRLQLRKQLLCLLSSGNNAETKQPFDYQRGNEEPNKDHRIVVAALSAAAIGLKQMKKISSCSESNKDSKGGILQPRKKTLCLLSCGNNAKTEQLYQRGNEGHRIVVAGINAAGNSFRQVKKHGSCSELNRDDIGGGLRLRKKSFCLLSDYNHTKMEPLDYQRSKKEQKNEDHGIVVSRPVKWDEPYRELNQDSIGGRLWLRKRASFMGR